MRDPNLCYEAFTITLKGMMGTPCRDTNTVNTYDWNRDKGKRYSVPSEYPYPDFDCTFFWKLDDNFDYSTKRSKNEPTIPPSPKNLVVDTEYNRPRRELSPYNTVKKSFILWIDAKSPPNAHTEQRLTTSMDVQVDFRETYAEGERHLSRIKNRIKPSTFLIICRGYYKTEDKNPLDLLQFLNQQGLRQILVIVYTQNKSDVMYYLQRQAPSMYINDWKERLFITDRSDDLIDKVKERFDRVDSW